MASFEEAAGIVAAIERFMRAAAPMPAPKPIASDHWQQAAMVEAVSGDSWADVPDPWINT